MIIIHSVDLIKYQVKEPSKIQDIYQIKTKHLKTFNYLKSWKSNEFFFLKISKNLMKYFRQNISIIEIKYLGILCKLFLINDQKFKLKKPSSPLSTSQLLLDTLIFSGPGICRLHNQTFVSVFVTVNSFISLILSCLTAKKAPP